MERLPVELRQEILQYLHPEDLKSIRLSSKLWAELGQGYLIKPTFLSLPYRNDFNRLLSVSRHPQLARYIEAFELHMGEMDKYHARNNIYFVQYLKDPEDRDEETRRAWHEMAVLDNQREMFECNYCNPELLEDAFKKLPNLTSIILNLTSCPFENELLQRVWKIPT